ncbi:MAG: energy transducer TonB [Bacteroidales bacterium]|nr:energy transducer TonB [Bacteroidales bacterium]
MIKKKSNKGNLEMRRTTYLLVGLVIVLALVYAGFELFATPERSSEMGLADDEIFVIVEDNIVNTDVQTPPPPPDPVMLKEVILDPVSDLIKLKPIGEIFLQDWIPDEEIPVYEIKPVEQEVDLPPPEYWVDEMPEFPGGEDAWDEYLRKELRYPEVCHTLGITGVVQIQFVVERDGSITNIKVLDQVYRDLDAEAVRVISGSPKWKPGKLMGKEVRVFYQMPIRFSLN